MFLGLQLWRLPLAGTTAIGDGVSANSREGGARHANDGGRMEDKHVSGGFCIVAWFQFQKLVFSSLSNLSAGKPNTGVQGLILQFFLF